jgi:phosphate ABC transporter, permease protein PstC
MRSARRSPFAKAGERVITGWIYLCGFLSIILVVLIFLFVFKEALPLLREYPFASFFLGTKWIPEPARGDPRFGLVPLLASSLLVTLGAIVIAVPLGLATAVYMSEIAPVKVREYLKPAVELLAAVPSVVLGFFGVAVLASLLQDTLHLPTGKTMLAGSVTLAFMAVPTIATISEDAINAVPRDVREGSYGLGATHWETIWRVLLPAAFSGIVAAVMLGVGRAIGETMVVLMVTGNGVSRALSDTMAGDFHRVFATYLGLCRTITATIAAEMGEVVQGGEHYRALFMLGVVLFLITFLINLVADFALRRAQRT